MKIFRLAIVSLVALCVRAPYAHAQADTWWESQTPPTFTGPKQSQQAAVDAWLQANTSFEQDGPCGALGTSQYRNCPIRTKSTGQPHGGIDVPLLCAPKTGTGSMQSLDGLSCPAHYVSSEDEPNAGCPDCNKIGDPIQPASGNVTHHEVDTTDGRLRFDRFYNSRSIEPGVLSTGWSYSFSRRVIARKIGMVVTAVKANDPRTSAFYATPAQACQYGWPGVSTQIPQWAGTTTATYVNGACRLTIGGVEVGTVRVRYGRTLLPPENLTPFRYDLVADDGRVTSYSVVGSSLLAPGGNRLQFTLLSGGGYSITQPDDSVETYAPDGRLMNVVYRGGFTVTAGYDTSYRLTTVAIPSARRSPWVMTRPVGYLPSPVPESSRRPTVTMRKGDLPP